MSETLADSQTPVRRNWRSVRALEEALNAGLESKTFSQDSIRWRIRHAATNGLAGSVRKIGKRIFIDEDGFRRWIDQGGAGA